MMPDNKATLEKANAAVARGDYENFLTYCTEDTLWNFIGEQTLRGKEAVRQYMAEVYVEPPVFDTENVIAEGDHVIATGTITLKDIKGKATTYAYCDVWRFYKGKLAELKAFVIEPAEE